MQAIKIIQVTASYKPAYVYGGPIMSVAKLCEALFNSKKVEVEVLTTTANGAVELPVNTNTKTIVDQVTVRYFKRLTKDHSHFSPSLYWALHKSIVANKKANQPTVVHIQAWWNLVSIFACMVAKYHKIPVVLSPRGMLTPYTLHNRHGLIKKLIHRFLGNNLLSYCHVHATSKQEQDEILQFIKPKSITLLPNLVELPKFTLKPFTKEENLFKIIFLSRVEQKKGIELLFEALAAVNFNFKLTIAGTGDPKYLRELQLKTEELQISNRILWLGHVNNEHKFQLIAEHDLFALTSYNENFANVVIESLHVGTPVLLSNKVGLADYVQENNLGWVTELKVKNMIEQLNEIYSAEIDSAQIRKNAPMCIHNDFDPNQLIEKYIQLYQSL